jgi:hypothetical protein
MVMQHSHLHIYHHFDAELVNALVKLYSQGDKIMAMLDALTAAVAAESQVVDSAVVLLQGLKAQLDAAIASGTDPVAIQAISDAIGAQTTKLADAVAANTPATP